MDTITMIGGAAIVLFVMMVTGNLKVRRAEKDDAIFTSGHEMGWMRYNKWFLIQTPSGYGRFSSARRNNSGTLDFLLETEEGERWVRGIDPSKDLIPITGEMVPAFLSGQAVYPIAITMDEGGGSVKVSMSQFLGIPDVNEALAIENERLRQRYTHAQHFSTNPHDGMAVWKTLKNEAQQLANISRSMTQSKDEREEVRVQRTFPFEGYAAPPEEGGEQ